MKELETILQDADAGDPITGLKRTRKTTRGLAKELRKKKYRVGHSTIPRLAKELGYTLKKNRKRLSRKQNEHRDEQMKYLTRQRKRFLSKNQPVISVDCKKKELIGQFRNPGRTLRKGLSKFWKPIFRAMQPAKPSLTGFTMSAKMKGT